MSENKSENKKVMSIRADEEIIKKFNSFCKDFSTQGECVNALINAYEISAAKTLLVGQSTNIDNFRSLIDSLEKAYINTLELNANTENRVRLEFEQMIDSQAKTIINLQEQLNKIKEERDISQKDSELKSSQIQNLQADLTAKTKENVQLMQAVQDKQQIIESLNNKLVTLDNASEKITEAETNAALAISAKNEAESKITALEKQIEENRRMAEIEKEKAVLESDKLNHERIMQLSGQTAEQAQQIADLKIKIMELSVKK